MAPMITKRTAFKRPLALDLSQISKPTSNVPCSFTSEYCLGAVLGSGTVAVVRRATRLVDGRQVAAKCSTSNDDEIHSFARREYELLSSLQHASIIHVDSFHASGHQSFMVMEIMEGCSLQSHVDKCGPFGEASAVHLLRQLLEAVDYLHAKRIVHRDVKPDNILLDEGANTLRLTDFNSATRIGGDLVDGPMLSHRGAELFRSPEQMLGLVWNERVDIWACGLCLYFAVQGELPFKRSGLTAKEMFAVGWVPEVCWSGLSLEIQHLLRQCLAINMEDRPPAMEMLNHCVFAMPRQEPLRSQSHQTAAHGYDRTERFSGNGYPAAHHGHMARQFTEPEPHHGYMGRQVTENSIFAWPDADDGSMGRQVSNFSNPDATSPTLLSPSKGRVSPKTRSCKRLQQKKFLRAMGAQDHGVTAQDNVSPPRRKKTVKGLLVA